MKLKLIILNFLAILLLHSCGINSERALRYSQIKLKLKDQKTEEAVKFLNTKLKDYSSREQLLLLMDRGILSFYNKQYSQAVQYLQQADVLQEDLYTESVTANVSSYLLNDNVKKYKGDDYELIYINVFKALSYMQLKNYEAAMVEVRKGQNKINILQKRYEEEIAEVKKESAEKGDNANISNYDLGDVSSVDSGVLRLLGIILYRLEEEFDDSRIDKEKLAALWKDYPQLYDFKTPDLNKIHTESDANFGFVDIFALEGQSPQKLAWDMDVMCTGHSLIVSSSIPGRKLKMDEISVVAGKRFNFSISVPFMDEIRSRTKEVKVFVDGQFKEKLDIVEKVSKFALNDYQKKKTFMIIKSAMRAFAKAYAATVAADQVQKEAGGAWGLAASIIGQVAVSASEVADTRSWNLLSDAFYFTELKLPFGEHNVEVQYIDKLGRVYHKHTKKVNINNTNPEIIVSYGL